MLNLWVSMLGYLVTLLQKLAPDKLFFYPILAGIIIMYTVVQWQVGNVEDQIKTLSLKLQECEHVHAQSNNH